MNPKNILHVLLHTKWGKIALVFLVVGLTASASAAVFEMYYGTATATVQTPDVRLVPGTDASTTCTAYPCATVSVSSNSYATVGVSMFATAANTPQPATYYTDLLNVSNTGTASHTINSITISSIAGKTTDLGSITVYYCTTQTNSPATSSSCAGFAITSSSFTNGGSITPTSSTLAPSSTGYFEVVAFANTTAAANDAITFQIGMSWT